MKARAFGWCSHCDGEIQPGDEIVPRPGGRPGSIHARCAPGHDDALFTGDPI